MKKILLIIMFGVVLLAGIVFSLGQINKIINFDKNIKGNLEDIGITNPIISPCVEINNRTCAVTIYQKGGINKKIEIETSYCEGYVSRKLNLTIPLLDSITSYMACESWKILTQIEIETEIEKKTEELLKSIAGVHDNRKETKEILTDEILITINDK